VDGPNEILDSQLLVTFNRADIGESQSSAVQNGSRHSHQSETAQLVSAGLLPSMSIFSESEFQYAGKGDMVTVPPAFVQSADGPPQENADRSNEQLIRRLGSSSYLQRQTASLELQGRGLCALPELLRAHNPNDAEFNARIAQVIDRIGVAAIPMMAAALEGDDPQLRAGATRSAARLPLESILDYVGETTNDPQRLQESRRILSLRQGWEDRASALLVRDNERGIFGPSNAQEFGRAIAAAQLLDSQPIAFHLSLEAGRSLLNSGNHQEALNSLDRSLTTLETNMVNDPGRVLFAVDLAQQLRDHLESTGGAALPQQVRAAITRRIEHAQALHERWTNGDE